MVGFLSSYVWNLWILELLEIAFYLERAGDWKINNAIVQTGKVSWSELGTKSYKLDPIIKETRTPKAIDIATQISAQC